MGGAWYERTEHGAVAGKNETGGRLPQKGAEILDFKRHSDRDVVWFVGDLSVFASFLALAHPFVPCMLWSNDDLRASFAKKRDRNFELRA